MKRKVLIRCDAGAIPEIGTGHLRRCLLLAERLTSGGAEIIFLTASSPEVVASIPYPTRTLPEGAAPADILKVLRTEKPDIVLWDRLDTSEEDCQAIKETGAILITMDDQGPGQNLADITINAMVSGGTTPYKGPEYAILPKASSPRDGAKPRTGENILLSFGGYDHAGMTATALKALSDINGGTQVRAIIGSCTPLEPLRRFENPNVRVLQAPDNFNELLRESSIAVVAGGLTLFEALANGIPCLVVAQYDHQLRTIERMEKAGAVVGLGRAESLDPRTLLSETKKLMADAPRRLTMVRKGRRLVDGLGLDRVRELCTVVDRLEWDSGFFGKNIANLYPRRINKDLVEYAFRKCREDAIDCLYYLCDCHDPKSVELAEEHGFNFVDIRLTFSLDLAQDRSPDSISCPFLLRPGEEKDASSLIAIASDAYIHSRYYFDRQFPDELCQRFYEGWIAKSLRGYADRVIVAEQGGEALGYITCKMASPVTGSIQLVGVSASAAGIGVGKALVKGALDWFREQGALSVEVVTQGRNYQAQRLYQSCGFKTLKTELWYHKWFEERAS